MIKIILMVCAAFMLLASSATAQNTLAVGPCTADAKRLCAGIQSGRDSLRACFRAHLHELSDACLLSLARLSAVEESVGAPQPRFERRTRRGPPRILPKVCCRQNERCL